MQTEFGKEDTLRILFSDEKFFDIDSVYNCQNEGVQAINCGDTDESEVVSCRNKSSPREKVMMCLDVSSSKDIVFLVNLDERTVDYSCYINNVLSVALKYGNEVFGAK